MKANFYILFERKLAKKQTKNFQKKKHRFLESNYQTVKQLHS